MVCRYVFLIAPDKQFVVGEDKLLKLPQLVQRFFKNFLSFLIGLYIQ